MNLKELQTAVNRAVERVLEDGHRSEDIAVSLQIDDQASSPWLCTMSNGVEVIYDNFCTASGCVIHGWRQSK